VFVRFIVQHRPALLPTPVNVGPPVDEEVPKLFSEYARQVARAAFKFTDGAIQWASSDGFGVTAKAEEEEPQELHTELVRVCFWAMMYNEHEDADGFGATAKAEEEAAPVLCESAFRQSTWREADWKSVDLLETDMQIWVDTALFREATI
jgi:hypothetical protein